MSWEKIAQDLTFYAFYVATKAGKTGLTVTVDVWEHTKTGTATEVVTAGNATEIGDGLYKYVLAAAAVDAIGEYVAVFKTADTSVDQKDIPALWTVGRADVAYRDAATSTRSTLTSAQAADAVWDEAIAGHVTPGTTGPLLSLAGAAADPLLNAVPGAYVAGTAGAALGRVGNVSIPIVATYNPTTMAMTYYYGDGYTVAMGRATRFTTTHTLTGGTVKWNVLTTSGLVTIPCTVVDANTYDLGPTAAQIMSLGVGSWAYDLEMIPLGSEPITEVAGTVTVVEDVR